MAKKKINVDGFEVRINKNNYVSLTDIAKSSNDEPRLIIQNWMKNTNTVRYLYEWEDIHNPDSNRLHLQAVLDTTTNNRFSMSPKKWIEMVGAIGITSSGGRYGGTYSHQDIALNFCYWLNPTFSKLRQK